MMTRLYPKHYICGLLLLAALPLLTTGCSSSAQPAARYTDASVQKIKDRGFIKIGCKTDVPLFSYKDPVSGQVEGFEIDLAKKIAKRICGSEDNVEFTGVTPQTRSELLDSGDIDAAIASFTITTERKKRYNFTESYYTDSISLLVRKSDDLHSLSGLNGKTVAVPQQTTTYQAIEEAAKVNAITVHMIRLPSYQACMDALQSGQADAYAMDQSHLYGYVNDDTVLLPDSFAPQKYGIATKKNNPGLCDLINETLQDMKESGEMDELLTKWKLTR